MKASLCQRSNVERGHKKFWSSPRAVAPQLQEEEKAPVSSSLTLFACHNAFPRSFILVKAFMATFRNMAILTNLIDVVAAKVEQFSDNTKRKKDQTSLDCKKT